MRYEYKFSSLHVYGSSHGDTRITRQAIGEGPEYVPLVLRSYEIWGEIERETGKKLLTIAGGLIMTSVEGVMRHGSNFLNQTVACAFLLLCNHYCRNITHKALEVVHQVLNIGRRGWMDAIIVIKSYFEHSRAG
jgi:hypothetical protein